MLRALGRLTGTVADYTVGTVIVMAHILMADRRARALLPATRHAGQIV